MANWYYYNKSGEKTGPISVSALKELTRQGLITKETIIENQNGRSASAGTVNGLMFPESTAPTDQGLVVPPVASEVYGMATPELPSKQPPTTVVVPPVKTVPLSAKASPEPVSSDAGLTKKILWDWGKYLLVTIFFIGVYCFKAADNNGEKRQGKSSQRIQSVKDDEIDESTLPTDFTPLQSAANADNLEEIESLLSEGGDVNEKGIYGKTPLAYSRSIKVAEFLVSKGANINAKDKDGKTPLFEAVSRGESIEVAKYLVLKGADVNAKDKSGSTPLHSAAGAYIYSHRKEENNLENVKFLVTKGANVNVKSQYGETPLHKAAYKGNVEVVKYLVAQGADVNAVYRVAGGCTPLQSLLWGGTHSDRDVNDEIEIINFLVSKGADVSVLTVVNNGTNAEILRINPRAKSIIDTLVSRGGKPLDIKVSSFKDIFEAAEKGTVEDVKYFIGIGVDVNSKENNYDGYTPLHKAVRRKDEKDNNVNGNLEVVEFLISKGADVNGKSKGFQDTPLHVAADPVYDRNNLEIIEFLVSKGANVNGRNKNNETPLFNAAAYQSYAVVEFLIHKDASVNVKNKDNETPLHRAAHFQSNDVIEFLIFKGAETDAKTEFGHTPLITAVIHENLEAVKSLVSKGANVNAKALAQTPLDIISEKQESKVSNAIKDYLISKGAKRGYEVK